MGATERWRMFANSRSYNYLPSRGSLFLWNRKASCQFFNLQGNFFKFCVVLDLFSQSFHEFTSLGFIRRKFISRNFVNDYFYPFSNFFHFYRSHTSSSQSRCSQTNSGRVKRWVWIVRDRVAVDDDSGYLQRFSNDITNKLFWSKVDNHEVIIGSSGSKGKAIFNQRFSKNFSVINDTL